MRVCISSNTGDYVTLEVDSQDTIGHIIDQYLLKEKLNKYFGEDSFASKLLNQYQRGEINAYRLHNAMYSYVNNIAEYEGKEITSSKIQAIVDNYSPEIFEKYTYQSIKTMYE